MTQTSKKDDAPITLAVINQPLCNRGDQAAFLALVERLKDIPGLRLLFLFIETDKAVRDFTGSVEGIQALAFPRLDRGQKWFRKMVRLPPILRKVMTVRPELRKYNRLIKQADYVLCAPGGVCLGKYRDWMHLWNLVNALDGKKKVAIYGRSIGPFDGSKKSDRLFRRRAVDVLQKAVFVSLRDKRSQQIAAELKIPFHPSIDTAFARTATAPLPDELAYLKTRRFAVFVPNQLDAWHPDFRKLPPQRLTTLYRAILDEILSRGYDAVLLPQLFGDKLIDHPYCRRLIRHADPNRTVLISDQYEADVQQAVIRRASLLIGARCHSVIFAIQNRVLFLALSYEHKIDGLLELLDLQDGSLPIAELLSDSGIARVSERIDWLEANRNSLLEKIKTAQQKARTIAGQSAALFASVIRKSECQNAALEKTPGPGPGGSAIQDTK